MRYRNLLLKNSLYIYIHGIMLDDAAFLNSSDLLSIMMMSTRGVEKEGLLLLLKTV